VKAGATSEQDLSNYNMRDSKGLFDAELVRVTMETIDLIMLNCLGYDFHADYSKNALKAKREALTIPLPADFPLPASSTREGSDNRSIRP